MNLINMRTGARVTTSSSKHDEIMERYKATEGYREATQLEYDLAGLMQFNKPADVRAALDRLIAEMETVEANGGLVLPEGKQK